MDFRLPPEMICIVKSYLSNQDLYNVELSCRFLFFASIPRTEKRLRKCRLWNQMPNNCGCSYCHHLCCWKYRLKYLSVHDIRRNDCWIVRFVSFKCSAEILKCICNSFSLTVEDIRAAEALVMAASAGNVENVKYLCETFGLTIADLRYGDCLAFRTAAKNGYLPVVQYLCEEFSLDTMDIRMHDELNLPLWTIHNENEAVARYIRDKYFFTNKVENQ
jgi:hypothetical protein